MKDFAKWAVATLFLVFTGFGFASDEKTRLLEVHARECIDYLRAFATGDYDPQKALRSSFENGVLVLRYDDEVIKQTDDLARKWMGDCGDLFDVDKYGPKLFRDSPLIKVLQDLIKDQNFAQRQSDQTVAEQAAVEKRSFKLKASFYNGVLEQLELITPYYQKFQYEYDAKYLIWGVLEGEYPRGLTKSTGAFSYRFAREWEGMYYYSPFKKYKTLYDQKSGLEKLGSAPKTWKLKDVPEGSASGKFSFDEDKFSAIPKGGINKNWALKLGGAVGMKFFVYTDEILEDNEWDPDSSANTDGFGTMDFLLDVTLGAIRCSPQSGRCLGFGSGYSKSVFLGKRIEKDTWGRSRMTSVPKYVDNVKVYGEMYFMSQTSGGLRESIDIPLNADMKYITSKTGFFYDDWRIRLEAGLEISPIQYIPGIYVELGCSFATNGLW